MRILVLDGNENQAVACVRSLSRAGHSVRIGADTRWSKAGLSRHADGTFRYASRQAGMETFVRTILDEVRPDTLVLPMTERTTLALSEARARIVDAGGRLVLPEHDDLLCAFDKQATHRLATSLGVPVPATTLVADEPTARDVAGTLVFPVVLKPHTSEEVTDGGATRATGAPEYARDAAGFLDAFRRLRKRCRAVLVQEFVAGAGIGYFALMRHGELRAEFAHRRLRDVRPTGSGSSLRESVAIDPRVRDHSLRLLRALRWHGVAMVEYRQPPEGEPILLEVNGRFWNSLALAVHASVDFPALLAHLAEHGDVPSPTGYRTGIRARWLVGDLQHLANVLAGAPPGFPADFPGRAATLARLLTPGRGTRHDNFEWSDPLPELGDWAHFAFRRMPAGLLRRRNGR